MYSDEDSESKNPNEYHSVGVLAFHKLQSSFSFGSTNFSPRRFEKLIGYLTRRDFSFGSIDTLLKNPSAKRIAISFDDGYHHLLKHLPGLIEKYQLAPIIFVPTAYIGRANKWDYSFLFQSSPHLDMGGIKRLAELGVQFGSHGYSHQPLTRLMPAALKEELEVSRKVLEDITGGEVTRISYPFGRCNRRVLDAAAEAGYTDGFTMNFPTSSDNPLARGRYAVYGYDTCFTVHQKLSGGAFYGIEKMKAGFTNRLSHGTGIYRFFRGERSR